MSDFSIPKIFIRQFLTWIYERRGLSYKKAFLKAEKKMREWF